VCSLFIKSLSLSIHSFIEKYFEPLLSVEHGSSRWEFSVGEEIEKPLSPHWAKENVPISQVTAGL